ncbi:MAG: hypothetical protein E7487_02785 [Ruminococcaceae bacterium]|nr:hypothetical protein [Oscillospiraceae bacterium]
MKMRNISKLLLIGSLLMMLIVLIVAGFAPWYVPAILALVAVLMVVAFLVLTLMYWRCPSCKLRFKMYDVDLEQSKICPRCGVNFADPNAYQVEYIHKDADDDADDDEDDE